MSSITQKLAAIESPQIREIPPFRVGDSVSVHFRIREGKNERVQRFEGVIIRQKRAGARSTFTVRKMASGGVGVERNFPVHSPRIEKIEVHSRGHVRRSKLYFLRELRGKKARLRASKRHNADSIVKSLQAVTKKRKKKKKAAAE